MSRDVPRDQPLTDEDRDYLMARGNEALVAQIDQMYPSDSGEEPAEADPEPGGEQVKPYEEWTVADLQAEIDARNKAALEDNPSAVAMSRTGTKAELVARLKENDAQQP